MAKNESKSIVISSCMAHGLKLNSVVLEEHLTPSNFQDSKLSTTNIISIIIVIAILSIRWLVPVVQ